MKLCRYGEKGKERPALIDQDGVMRDLSAHLTDIDAQALAPKTLAAVAAMPVAGLPVVPGSPRLGTPVTGTSKFIGIGLNYRDHAQEAGLAIPLGEQRQTVVTCNP